MTQTPLPLLTEIVHRWHAAAVLETVSPLTPDASLRRYYRLGLSGAPVAHLVAMVFDSVASPEHSGVGAVGSDQAYVELTRFFRAHGVAVPELYFDARAQSVLLIEDLGDIALADIAQGKEPLPFGSGSVELLYRQAIDTIIRLQSIPAAADCFAYQRAFTAPQYRREMEEFVDYVLGGPGEPASAVAGAFFDELAEELGALPRVLAHRDFHSWNLLVAEGRVRVIDFQDALLATKPYDLVGLLNDRDTDALLGQEAYWRLVEYFQQESSYGTSFPSDYDRVLLQRDLKVAGRFRKLVTERGLDRYQVWVPGTLRRIGRTLERLAQRGDLSPKGQTFLAAVQGNVFLPEVESSDEC
ncbi:MAG: phosphotransferase, partial [Bdellovibrionales bacterium]|nr:phosphotransferase [Bdellovibrionales bacterium]